MQLPEVCVVCCGVSRLNKPVCNLQIDFDLYLLHLFVTDIVCPSFWQIAEIHPRRRSERSPRRGGRARGGRGSRSTEDCWRALWSPPMLVENGSASGVTCSSFSKYFLNSLFGAGGTNCWFNWAGLEIASVD